MLTKSNNLVMGLVLAILTVTTNVSAFAQQNKKTDVITDKATLAKLRAAVEASPDSLKMHEAYIKAMGIDNPEVEKQYAIWMKKYPKAAGYPYGLGKAYEDRESPKAKPYLLKTVALDPGHTEAWGGLWIDAERWGDFAGAREYLAKAVASDATNANYAFYYASSFREVDPEKYVQMSLDVAKRFPANERGAQALYWLGSRSPEISDKLKYFDLLRRSYAPAKFNWSSSGMSSYYDLLLSENPAGAVELSKAMANEFAGDTAAVKEWSDLAGQAELIAGARKFIAEKKGGEAMTLLNQVKLPRYFGFNKKLALWKAKADNAAGNTKAAYDSLVGIFSKGPRMDLKADIDAYGIKMGKNQQQVMEDIWKGLDAVARPATPFSLKRYLTTGTTALADYKGKVVLLTYWFPGCGPCRGEFPHFERVVRKFKGQDLEYVGINIVSEQNDYVVPFMKKSGYSFTPLEDVTGRVKGNLDNRNAAPVNFLIDQKGRLIFSDFRTDGDNEDELELMINLLLTKKTS